MIDLTRQGLITRLTNAEISALIDSASGKGMFLFMKENTADENIYTVLDGGTVQPVYNAAVVSDLSNNLTLVKNNGVVIIGDLDGPSTTTKLKVVGSTIINGNINSSANIPQSTNNSIGLYAADNLTTGNNNIFIGYNCGTSALGEDLVTGNGLVYIGANIEASSNNLNNEIVIGSSTNGHGSNTTTIGNNSTNSSFLYGNLYIGYDNQSGNSATIYGLATVNSLIVNGNTTLIGNTSMLGNTSLAGKIKDSTNNYGLNKILTTNSTGYGIWKTKSELSLIDGGGTTSYIPKFTSGGTSGATVGDSVIYQNGPYVGVNTLSPISHFDVKMATNQHIQFAANTYGNYSGAPGIISMNDAATGYTPLGFYASKYFFGNGSVGIGTNNPYAKIHSVGDAIFTGNINTKYLVSSIQNNNSIGGNALAALTAGNNNTVIGNSAGRYMTSGIDNVMIGYLAGSKTASSTNKIYSAYSTYIGSNTGSMSSGNTVNEIVIGYGAIGNGNNTITLGKYNAIDYTHINGEIFVKAKNPAVSDPDGWIISPYDINGSYGNTFKIDGSDILNFNIGDTFVLNYSDEELNGGFSFSSTITNIIDSHTFTTADPVPTNFVETYPGGYVTPNTAITTIQTSMAGNINTSNIITLNGNILPSYTSYYNLGSASKKWGNIYAYNGTIITSDARLKTDVENFTTNEINASIQLSKEIGTFKFLAAIAEKGDNARKHIGITVQKAIEIMQINNLNPFDYGFICYDSWDGGDAYSIRYEELLMFIAKGFEERLTRLENNN